MYIGSSKYNKNVLNVLRLNTFLHNPIIFIRKRYVLIIKIKKISRIIISLQYILSNTTSYYLST